MKHSQLFPVICMTALLCPIHCTTANVSIPGLSKRQEAPPVVPKLERIERDAEKPKICLRGEIIRTPEQVEAAGGFYARGWKVRDNIPPAAQEVASSLYSHAKGDALPCSLYISGTTDAKTALASARIEKLPDDVGHVYRFRATKKTVDMNRSLGKYSPFPEQFEQSTIGFISWEDVEGHYVITNDMVSDDKKKKALVRNLQEGTQEGFVPNPKYRPKSAGTTGSGASPQLAGFPEHHTAWSEKKWKPFKDKSVKETLQSMTQFLCRSRKRDLSCLARVAPKPVPSKVSRTRERKYRNAARVLMRGHGRIGPDDISSAFDFFFTMSDHNARHVICYSDEVEPDGSCPLPEGYTSNSKVAEEVARWSNSEIAERIAYGPPPKVIDRWSNTDILDMQWAKIRQAWHLKAKKDSAPPQVETWESPNPDPPQTKDHRDHKPFDFESTYTDRSKTEGKPPKVTSCNSKDFWSVSSQTLDDVKQGRLACGHANGDPHHYWRWLHRCQIQHCQPSAKGEVHCSDIPVDTTAWDDGEKGYGSKVMGSDRLMRLHDDFGHSGVLPPEQHQDWIIPCAITTKPETTTHKQQPPPPTNNNNNNNNNPSYQTQTPTHRIQEAINSTRRWHRDHKTTPLSEADFVARYLRQQSKRDPPMAVLIQRALRRRVRGRYRRGEGRPASLDDFCRAVVWRDVIETVERVLVREGGVHEALGG
ncbi:Heat-labile enterotoxin IIB, A chain [Ophiocordyceps camponoti-floridani]|uniref:Heat-labile enterotoxin IIB, A chain n=1 Tax=Ophiocordyceps camponoti-floridani TaxID=2030778 RepID=A0A8H4Q0X4_9HYPO|nr:Heat-labile enterotoxin IIB, A chain [Ophiocordyceps camponoti-floridani]